MSAPQNPAERDSVGKALARTANPAHAASYEKLCEMY